jgi:hypothetical protein
MYAGYTILHEGFLLAFPSFWNIALYSTELAIQMARLLREERLLNQDQSYRNYAGPRALSPHSYDRLELTPLFIRMRQRRDRWS